MKTLISLLFLAISLQGAAHAALEINGEDASFFAAVERELSLMREGKRGIVVQTLVERLDASPVATKIKPVTRSEETWHPNDRKGTRSHLVPQDTKIQGAERREPTAAVVYIHPSRVDPSLSLFKLGTFVYFLALAADLNAGQFSGDYRIRERRAVFFSNAWKDSAKYPLLANSDNVPTTDYQKAKESGLINEAERDNFPILETPSTTLP